MTFESWEYSINKFSHTFRQKLQLTRKNFQSLQLESTTSILHGNSLPSTLSVQLEIYITMQQFTRTLVLTTANFPDTPLPYSFFDHRALYSRFQKTMRAMLSFGNRRVCTYRQLFHLVFVTFEVFWHLYAGKWRRFLLLFATFIAHFFGMGFKCIPTQGLDLQPVRRNGL